jgi:BolA protein
MTVSHPSTRAERLRHALAVLAPTALEVLDESHQHLGHAGHRPEGETHYRIRIVAGSFAGKSRVDIHRLINALAAPEFATGLHALAIEAKAG